MLPTRRRNSSMHFSGTSLPVPSNRPSPLWQARTSDVLELGGMFRQCTGSSAEMIQRCTPRQRKRENLARFQLTITPPLRQSFIRLSRQVSWPSLLRRMRGWPREPWAVMHGHQLAGPFLDAVDLLGTFVFALSGAAAGVKSRFDLFGLMALSFAAGNAGGITRDVLIGAVPPAAISDWRYLGVSLLAGLVTFFWYPNIDKRRRLVLLFDGAGLGLFAVAGTQKALIAGLNPVMAVFMGVLTGIGGGILRDVLVNQTRTVLEADIYAVAALAAGVVVVIGYDLRYRAFVVLTVGALLCFWLRVMAIYRGWHLPVAQSQNRRD